MTDALLHDIPPALGGCSGAWRNTSSRKED